MPKRKKINKGFFKKWSPAMAYVLGFFTADGSLTINGRGHYYIEFYSCDKESIEKVKELLGSEHKISKVVKGFDWKPAYRIQIGSKDMCNDLLRLGMIPAKSNVINFPEVPLNHFSHFVRGYFDGDGHVHLGQYWRRDRNKWHWVFSSGFTSGSKSFLVGLWESLKKYVSGGCLYKKNRGYGLTFSRHDSLALFKLMYNNTSASMFLKRKRMIFLKAFETLNLGA